MTHIKKIFAFIFDSLTKNLTYKVLALLLAALVWALIQGREIIEINSKVQVKIIVPEGYGVEGQDSLVKDVTIRGSRALLANLLARDIHASIHLNKKIQASSLRVRLDSRHIHKWDKRLKLTVHEPYIALKIAPIATKTLPIEAFLQGVPSEHYIIEKIEVVPATVTVSGLDSQLAKLERIATQPIVIEGLERNKSMTVDLANNGLTYSVERVQVNLLIGSKKVNREYHKIPIKIINATTKIASLINPQAISITVQGNAEVLNFIANDAFEASINIKGLEVGKHEQKIQVKIPEDTVLIKTIPEYALIEVDTMN
ncbi:MAG: CdaR family protein [Pseudomonadota bacterium]|nr:CdaR family protein [Pseudomonadota bacterium]